VIIRNLLILVLIFASQSIIAQQNNTMFFEPEIGLEYRVNSKYKHSFNMENRNFIYQNADFEYQVKHLEFSHTSEFLLKENKSIGMGIQYRFEENFIDKEENEFRLLQEYSWNQLNANTALGQQLKNEQRFYNSTTKYRLRYEIKLKILLEYNNPEAAYFKTETETLFEVAKTQKPEYEQRLSVLMGWQIHKKNNLEIGLQYRMADYTQNLGHELFLTTSFNVSL